MTKRRPSPSPTRITIAEAAERIGVSVWTIRRRIADGTLHAWRIKSAPGRVARGIRLDPADVDALLTPMSGGAA